MDICGNCGAPLDLNDDGECRWCRAKAQARHSRSFGSGSRPALNWKRNRRVATIAAIAIALAAGLGAGIASYVGGHQPGPPTATASERWTVPPTATWWARDIGGNVTSVATSGDYAAITDADGISYTVGINPAFVFSGNPGTVLLISPSSTVMSMSLAQATAARQPLAR